MFKLKFLINRRHKILKSLTNIIASLEKTNEELSKLKQYARNKIATYEQMHDDADKSIKENYKTLNKIKDLVE